MYASRACQNDGLCNMDNSLFFDLYESLYLVTPSTRVLSDIATTPLGSMKRQHLSETTLDFFEDATQLPNWETFH
jgi:hypothetical protein